MQTDLRASLWCVLLHQQERSKRDVANLTESKGWFQEGGETMLPASIKEAERVALKVMTGFECLAALCNLGCGFC